MDKKIELLNDYNECQKKINTFTINNYKEYENWANKKYDEWLAKDKDFIPFSPQNGFIPPQSDIESSMNTLRNFKNILLENMIKKGIDVRKNNNF